MDDRENGWGRWNRPKVGMRSPLEGSGVVKGGRKPRLTRVSCPEKGDVPGLKLELLEGEEDGHLGEMEIWGDD